MTNTFKLADEILLPYFTQKGYDVVRFCATGAKGDEYVIIDQRAIIEADL